MQNYSVKMLSDFTVILKGSHMIKLINTQNRTLVPPPHSPQFCVQGMFLPGQDVAPTDMKINVLQRGWQGLPLASYINIFTLQNKREMMRNAHITE